MLSGNTYRAMTTEWKAKAQEGKHEKCSPLSQRRFYFYVQDVNLSMDRFKQKTGNTVGTTYVTSFTVFENSV